MYLVEKKNFIYVYDSDRQYEWMDAQISSSGRTVLYFPINETTKRFFSCQIAYKIGKGEVDMDQNSYNKIINFKQNPEREQPISMTEMPEGIKLFKHQEDALALMATHNKYGFFYGTGTGKTLIAITWLMNAKPESCLIVTPQKVVGQYKSELDKYIPGNEYDVTNFEQLHKFVTEDEVKYYEAIIVDESHRAKNYTSDINKNLRELSKYATYVYIFTGTPQDKSRHEILPQLAILDERVMPVKTKIYERYFRIDDYFQPKHEIRDRSEELSDLIKCYTYGVKTENVVNLTEEKTHIIKCEHPRECYNELLNDRVVSKDGLTCIADSKAQLRLSLKEICSGILSMQDDNYERHWTKLKSPKEIPLLSLLRELDTAIIYYEFTESNEEIKNVITSLGKTYVLINGETTAKNTRVLADKFKKGEVNFLVIQTRSGNAGLDLTNTNNVVFYSLPDSYIVFHQAKGRIRRIGQERECNYYYLICEDTVEQAIYDTLRRKKNFNDRVFAQYIKE